MNERIKELIEQAGFITTPNTDVIKHNPFGGTMQGQQFEFAVLIVRECIAQIQPMKDQVQKIGAPPGYDYDTFILAYDDCINVIEEHFGVKQ